MELLTIPLEGPDGAGKFILYRPLAGIAFVGNRAMADLARRLVEQDPHNQIEQGQPAEFLKRIGFLEPDPTPPAPAGGDFSPAMAVLLMTNQCQLRCVYCYASAGEFTRSELSPELGKTIIAYACATAQKMGRSRFEISFHGGGEPTLAWGTLQDCVEFARQQALPANITLTSNGVWSEAHTDWLIDHLDGLSLSMDGDPATQDHYRPYINGQGSSAAVMRTIARLDQRKFKYGIRMTAAAPWSDLPRNVRFICEQTGCPSMQVEPAFNTERGGHPWPTKEDALAYGAAFMEAYDIAEQAGRRLTYSGARLGMNASTFCTAPFQALVGNAHGELVACYEITGDSHPLRGLSTIGRIENGQVRVDQAARNGLHRKMAERRAGCRECICYWSCAGDCYTRSFLPGQDGHLQYSPRCDLNRFLLKELLLRGLEKGDGVWRSANMRRQKPPAGEAVTI